MPYLERAVSPYLERAVSPYLKKRAATSKCLLLTGARQVGKSAVIRHVFPELNRTDFDDLLTRLQAKEEPRLFFSESSTSAVYWRSSKGEQYSRRNQTDCR